jgi:hypothetical protein
VETDSGMDATQDKGRRERRKGQRSVLPDSAHPLTRATLLRSAKLT